MDDISRRQFLRLAGSACASAAVPLPAFSVPEGAAASDPLHWVDTRIGTGGHGHCFPGSSVPFAAVQLSPDTFNDEWDWCSGYHISDTSIMGFSHTHLSGTGCGDLLDFLVMAGLGPVKLVPGPRSNPGQGYRSRFSHADEISEPGYYSVLLSDPNVRVELTSTERTGIHRYTFPTSNESWLIVDLAHSYLTRGESSVYSAEITQIAPDTLAGGHVTSAWGRYRHCCFTLQVSKTPSKIVLYSDDKPVALPDALHFERVERLREMGSNACRTAHNPPAAAFLDACDRLGILVLEETRMMGSTEEGLSQLQRMILRDRNHPSVILWSLSNEEPDQGGACGARIEAAMKRLVRRLDPNRMVTAAMNNSWGRGLTHIVDVQGFNYAGGAPRGGIDTGRAIDEFHKQFPRLPTIATETASVFGTRGTYSNDPSLGLVSAYDVNFPEYTKSSEGWWNVIVERDFLAGGFAWTGFDYRGEPVPYPDISVGSQFGIMDACGFPKDVYFYYKSWWTNEDVLHLFPHWNWTGREGQNIDVWCYSNLEAVELFLNGRDLGRLTMPRNGHLQWSVHFQPGKLEARGYRGGKVVLSDSRETTGPAARLALRPRKASLIAGGEDVCSVAVEVQDSAGRVVPDAASMIRFRVTGPARVIGLGNGDPNTRESDKPVSPQAGERSAFHGLAMIYVQSTMDSGDIEIQADAGDLTSARLSLTAEKPKSTSARS